MLFRPHFVHFPDDGKGGAGGSGNDAGGDGKDAPEGGKPKGDSSDQQQNFETWLEKQPQDVKDLYDGHVKGLKTALKSEREARETKEAELRDMAKKAEKGSELEKALTKLADQEADANRRAEFYDAAHAAGVKNLKLAYLVAVSEELFDRRGIVNFEELKKQYPELFGEAQKLKGNAGSGTGSKPPGQSSMNDWIRKKAGVQ